MKTVKVRKFSSWLRYLPKMKDWSATRPGCNECESAKKMFCYYDVHLTDGIFAAKRRSLQPGRVALQSAPRI